MQKQPQRIVIESDSEEDDDNVLKALASRPPITSDDHVIIIAPWTLVLLHGRFPAVLLPVTMANTREVFEQRKALRAQASAYMQDSSFALRFRPETTWHTWVTSEMLHNDQRLANYMMEHANTAYDYDLSTEDEALAHTARDVIVREGYTNINKTPMKYYADFTIGGVFELSYYHVYTLLTPDVDVSSPVIDLYFQLLDILHGTRNVCFGSLASISDPRADAREIDLYLNRANNERRASNSWLKRLAQQRTASDDERVVAYIALHMKNPEHYVLMVVTRVPNALIAVVDVYDTFIGTDMQNKNTLYGLVVSRLKAIAFPNDTVTINETRFTNTFFQTDSTSCGPLVMFMAREQSTLTTHRYAVLNRIRDYRKVFFIELMRQRIPLYWPTDLPDWRSVPLTSSSAVSGPMSSFHSANRGVAQQQQPPLPRRYRLEK